MGQDKEEVTLRREHEKLRCENEKLKEALKTQGAELGLLNDASLALALEHSLVLHDAAGATYARMDSLIGKINMGVLLDNERNLLTSALNSGALLLGADEEEEDDEEPMEEDDSSEGALVKRLKADLKKTIDELQREKKLSECFRVLRKLDWSSLSEGDWYFACDALTAGCRAARKPSRPPSRSHTHM